MAVVNLNAVAELGCWLHLVNVKGLEVRSASPSPHPRAAPAAPRPVTRVVHWAAGAQDPSESTAPPAPDQNLPPWKDQYRPLEPLPVKS